MQGDLAFADSLVQCLSAEQAKNSTLMETVEKMLPKTVYYDNILQTPNAMPVSIIAKDYGMSAVAFNKLLHEMRVQYRVGTTWLLYKKYANKGYVLSKTYIFDGERASVYTCWTQRGRQFLYELLKWYGVLPIAERSVV
jgi:phage antirepressor YoqD-like protein